MIEPLEILAKAAVRELGPEHERLRKAGWSADLVVDADEPGEATVSLRITLKANVPVESVRDAT